MSRSEFGTRFGRRWDRHASGEAVLDLSQRSRVVSVIARGSGRLASLQASGPGNIEALALDYCNDAQLDSRLSTSVAEHGPIDLAVVWIHENAPNAPQRLANRLAENGRRVTYVHVLSSAHADPAGPRVPWRDRFATLTGLAYQEVILGFVLDPQGSRWLTHKEISDGVLQAISQHSRRFVVGTVSPWSSRP